MKLTIKTKLILFALGAYYKIMNRRFKSKGLEVALSKSDFISLVKNAGIEKKQPRSIYKNLETLEKKRYITYDNKTLKFTPAGEKRFKSIEKELMPYFRIIDTIKMKNVTRFTKKPQTLFKFT
ncbi:MAG: hypothetical protein ABII01_06210 [Candidatus Woesearchaeota archaeon]